MSGGIYISYRRDDASSLAGRLYARLLEHLPQDNIFMDVDRVAHGEDLVKTIEKAIESTEFLIAVIGKQSLNDRMRVELATAFKLYVQVIPVLVEGASMPFSCPPPCYLRALARLSALEISDTNFDASCRLLISVIPDRLVGFLDQQGRSQEVVEAYGELVRINPYSDDAHLGLAGLLEQQGRFREAIETYCEVDKIEHWVKQAMGGTVRFRREKIDTGLELLADSLDSRSFRKEGVHRAVNVPGEPERSPVDCTVAD
jgi:tetratricopeptide (TPR) repeat protein